MSSPHRRTRFVIRTETSFEPYDGGYIPGRVTMTRTKIPFFTYNLPPSIDKTTKACAMSSELDVGENLIQGNAESDTDAPSREILQSFSPLLGSCEVDANGIISFVSYTLELIFLRHATCRISTPIGITRVTGGTIASQVFQFRT